jgi:hypothetical protein
VQAGASAITVALTSDADPALYDAPLTLETRVPESWTKAVVTQGTSKSECAVNSGKVRYAAVPGAVEIVIAKR